MIRRFVKRVLTPPLVILAAFVMFCEEWLWDRISAFTAWVAKLPIFQRLEQHLSQLSPYAALAVLVLPGTLLFPIKFAALYYIAHGHAVAGISVIIAAKLIGTAIVARMFAVCRTALMQIGWLKRLTDGIIALKNWLYARIKSMPGWAYAVKLKGRLRLWISSWRKDGIRRRWLAIMRWHRRPDATPSSPNPPVLPPSGNNSDPL